MKKLNVPFTIKVQQKFIHLSIYILHLNAAVSKPELNIALYYIGDNKVIIQIFSIWENSKL